MNQRDEATDALLVSSGDGGGVIDGLEGLRLLRGTVVDVSVQPGRGLALRYDDGRFVLMAARPEGGFVLDIGRTTARKGVR
jgi:hypothetical protein